MAQDITVQGASYTGVPAVDLPKTGGGTARFIDQTDVITYYTGSSAPDPSLGKDGDIYLQT